MILLCYFQEKGQEALDFILSIITRMEDEKHTMVIREVINLTNRYPSCLTINVINKLSTLEDGSTSKTIRAYIQELRNDFNAKNSTREHLNKNTSTGGVTIVKVGGGSGSRGELTSYGRITANSNNSNNNDMSSLRAAVASVRASTAASVAAASATGSEQQQQHPLAVTSITTRSRVDSRSTGKLPTHRSMTKLNANNFDAASRAGGAALHKSMTRLNISQQNMARINSSGQMFVPASASGAARSITCISNNLSRPSGAASLTTSNVPATGSYYGGRVTVSTTGMGASLPTKSMSSGSMSGVVDQIGREILTVNVNQIHQDLVRHVSEVSETVNQHQHDHQATHSNNGALKLVSSSGVGGGLSHQHIGPISRPRTVQPSYSSGGPLNSLPSTSSQPPSLMLFPSTTTTPHGPVLPLAPYETSTPNFGIGRGDHGNAAHGVTPVGHHGASMKHQTISSAVSQPLSSNPGQGGSAMLTDPPPPISGQPPRGQSSTNALVATAPVPSRRSNFSNTLPSPRRRKQMEEMLSKDDSDATTKPSSKNVSVS